MMILHQATTDRQPWKVRRMPGSKNTYQVCYFDGLGGVEEVPGFWDNPKEAQVFADVMNQLREGAKSV